MAEGNDDNFGEKFFTGKKEPGKSSSDEEILSKPFFSFIANFLQFDLGCQRVLDVGCARGALVFSEREAGLESFGVDISKYAISQAPEEIRSFLKTVNLDSENLPHNDDSFDAVTALGVLEYLRDDTRAIKEIRRVLRDNGTLLFFTIFIKPPDDQYRINIHERKDWIEKFTSHGFEFMQQMTDDHQWDFLSLRLNKIDPSRAKAVRLLSRLPAGKSAVAKYAARSYDMLFFRIHKSD